MTLDADGMLRVGKAGWSLPSTSRPSFDPVGTHLERYASRLPAVEINSSFHRPHRRTTYERWAANTPPGFRFSVKLPRTISHAAATPEHDALIDRFASEVAGLGDRLGLVLVQYPPKHAFERRAAETAFAALQAALPCPLVCEPRHASWFTPEAADLLRSRRIARVAADPARVAGAGEPGGWLGLHYHRLHGSPRIYRSSYDDATLAALAETMQASMRGGVESWCVFDNTASGAATADALSLIQRLNKGLV